MLRILTGIGSRKTTKNAETMIINFAARLVDKYDCWIRSGHAHGADYAWEQGARDRCIVYLPYPHFNQPPKRKDGVPLKTKHVVVWDKAHEQAKRRALRSVWDHHPAYEYLKPGPRKMHARNYFQVFGSKEKEQPSQAVICWAKPNEEGDGVTGGTGQAVRLANHFGIPVFNLHPEAKPELYKIEQELDKIWNIS